jgi:hypothetical protein
MTDWWQLTLVPATAKQPYKAKTARGDGTVSVDTGGIGIQSGESGGGPHLDDGIQVGPYPD